MVCESFKASAPGSFMISGEHAILRGELGLIAAIQQRIYVELIPRNDRKVIIDTDTLGTYQTSLDGLTVEAPFQFLLTAISLFQTEFLSGFHLKIKSEVSHQMGLSSSAAVTVASLAVFAQFLQRDFTEWDIYKFGCNVVKLVQKAGSGADIATAIFGGVLGIEQDPLKIMPINVPELPWYLVYTGYKTPTSEVIALVNRAEERYPAFYKTIFNAMGKVSLAIAEGLKQHDAAQVGEWMNRHCDLQSSIQLVCKKSKQILDICNALPDVLGAKLSGSGLGDCVLVLGELPENTFAQQMYVKIADKGLRING